MPITNPRTGCKMAARRISPGDILRGAAALPRPGAVPEPAPDVRKPLLGRVMRFRNRNENKESGK